VSKAFPQGNSLRLTQVRMHSLARKTFAQNKLWSVFSCVSRGRETQESSKKRAGAKFQVVKSVLLAFRCECSTIAAVEGLTALPMVFVAMGSS